MLSPRTLRVLTAALALAAASCGGSATTTTGPGAAMTDARGGQGTSVVFTSEVYPFAVSHPPDWTVQRDFMGTVVIFLSPLIDADDTFSENVNVVVEDLQGVSLSLDEYMDLTLSSLEAVIDDFDIFDEGPDILGGEAAYFIAYTGTEPSMGLSLTWVQTIALYEGQAYVITYTGDRDFALFADAAAAIFDSWEWR